MGQCLAVPPEGSRSVRTHQVADFLKGIVEKAAVTENGLLVPVGKFLDDRPNLPFEIYETVDLSSCAPLCSSAEQNSSLPLPP